MKKLVLLLITLFISNCAFAGSFSFDGINKFIKNHTTQESIKQTKPISDDSLSQSEQATLLYNENNVKSSFETLLAIKESERTAQDCVLLGNILQDQDKIADAVFMYKRAILLDSKFYKPYYNLGNIYLEEEKYYLAIDNYRMANKINNQFPYAYYNLGCAYLKIGNLKKAKIVFLKAIELKNTEPNFHYNLAYTYKKLNNQKLAKQYLSFYNKLMENNQ